MIKLPVVVRVKNGSLVAGCPQSSSSECRSDLSAFGTSLSRSDFSPDDFSPCDLSPDDRRTP